jgi:hypothetical protein
MERSRFSAITSLFAALLFTGTIVLGGCGDSLTGTAPPDAEEEVTVQSPPAQHNSQATDGEPEQEGTDTDPGAGHNTSDED